MQPLHGRQAKPRAEGQIMLSKIANPHAGIQPWRIPALNILETKMAGQIPDLEAQERTGTGKGAARQARRDGMVPVSTNC